MAVVYIQDVKRSDFKSEKEYREATAANVDAALKKLRKKCANEGTLKIYREKMFYKSKGDKAREKAKNGRRKQLRKMSLEKKYYKD